MSAVNTLRVDGATLHVAPAGEGYDVSVITKDGIQVTVVMDGASLGAFADEASDVLAGAPASFHAAGMRLQDRLNRIKQS